MNYNNITYPLDKIYSNATGVAYPVCGAGHGSNPEPVGPGEFGELQIYRTAEVPNYNFNAVMQCTGYMDSNKSYEFTNEANLFTLILVVDPEDNTKLIMDTHNDSQYIGDLDEGETGTTLPCTITDLTTLETTTGDAANYRVMN